MIGDKRIAWIDLARVLAIACIVGFHVAYEFTLDDSLRQIGYIGASLFFIISGFMLAKHDPNLASFGTDYVKWLWNRYARIAALYYPTLIVIFVLFGSQVSDAGFIDLVKHILFLNGMSSALTYSIVSPAWFIIPLISLYALYPAINNLMKRHPAVLTVACAISLAIRLSKPAWVSAYPLFFIADFCFGMAFAQGRRDIFMLSPLMLAFAGPVMALPYAVFALFSLIPNMRVLGFASFIGRHTFEIFLFHESLMKALLGKWKVFGMDTLGSTAVLAVCLGAVALAAGPLSIMLKKMDGFDVQGQV